MEAMQFLLSGVLIGGIYGLIAVAFIVIYRSSQLFNVAQGEIVMFGGFFAWTFLANTPMPIWLSIIVAMGVSAALGLLIERVAIRPLIGQPLFAQVMVTIALILILRAISMIAWGPLGRPFPALFGERALAIGAFDFSPSMFYGFIISIVAVGGLWWMFNRTKRGLTMSAVAENHQVARALGISVKQSMALAWAIAGAICVLAATIWLSGRAIGYMTAEIGLRAIPCALLAGLESIPGALLAGIIVGIAESMAVGYVDPIVQGGFSSIIPFIIMLIVLWIRPQGMFGWKIIERL